MKTFQQYLTEAQAQHSVFDSIVNNWMTPPVFFTPTVMKRLEITIENVLAFHGTDLPGFHKINKLQGKKSAQLSTTSGENVQSLRFVATGVETTGGVLAWLEGDISAYFDRDAFTGLTKGGRRTVLIGPNTDFANFATSSAKESKRLATDLQNDLREVIANAIAESFLPTIRAWNRNADDIDFMTGNMIDKMEFFEKDLESLKSSPNRLQVCIDGNSRAANPKERHPGIVLLFRFAQNSKKTDKYTKMLLSSARELVKRYMDGMERVLNNNKDYKKLFVTPERPGGHILDELIMSNFTIKEAIVRIDFFRNKEPRENADELNIPDKAFVDKFGKDPDELQQEIVDLRKQGAAQTVDERVGKMRTINNFIAEFLSERVRKDFPKTKLTFVESYDEMESEIAKMWSKNKSNPQAAVNKIYSKPLRDPIK